jgi:KUP system potassium uptake protein
MIGAFGVVFGDIGTSPIYAFHEALKAAGETAGQATILGVLSLVFWAVVLVVAVKYVVFVMWADNQGEGGTVALLSQAVPVSGRWAGVVLAKGLTGAALFFGNAMIGVVQIRVTPKTRDSSSIPRLFENPAPPPCQAGPSWTLPDP